MALGAGGAQVGKVAKQGGERSSLDQAEEGGRGAGCPCYCCLGHA